MGYKPEEWVLVRITGTDPHYSVFGSWRGGYLHGDSWRMNSGVVAVEEDGDFYIFKGGSGSTYACHKEAYGIRSPYNSSILYEFCNNSADKMVALEEIPDIMNIDWFAK